MSGSHRYTHTTAMGRTINMEILRSQHADMRARGNASMNARGDVLDENGKIRVSRDQIVQAYNLNRANNSPVSLKNRAIENAETPAQAVARMEKEINAKRNAINVEGEIQQDVQQEQIQPTLPKKARRILLDKSE
jgi:hypothetical protein